MPLGDRAFFSPTVVLCGTFSAALNYTLYSTELHLFFRRRHSVLRFSHLFVRNQKSRSGDRSYSSGKLPSFLPTTPCTKCLHTHIAFFTCLYLHFYGIIYLSSPYVLAGEAAKILDYTADHLRKMTDADKLSYNSHPSGPRRYILIPTLSLCGMGLRNTQLQIKVYIFGLQSINIFTKLAVSSRRIVGGLMLPSTLGGISHSRIVSGER